MRIEPVLARLADGARLHEQLGELAPLIGRAAQMCVEAVRAGGKIVFFGNGGSASDAQHLACEMVVKYRFERPSIPAVALTTDTSILTAASNDLGFEQVFVRQIQALARRGDVAVAISTSGASRNVLAAVEAARRIGCGVVVLTGEGGRGLADSADVGLVVPSRETDLIQECHITLGHVICQLVESELYGEKRA